MKVLFAILIVGLVYTSTCQSFFAFMTKKPAEKGQDDSTVHVETKRSEDETMATVGDLLNVILKVSAEVIPVEKTQVQEYTTPTKEEDNKERGAALIV